MVVLAGVVEVGDGAETIRRLQKREVVVAGSAGQGVSTVVADQHVIAASAAQRLGAVSGDDDVIAAGPGQCRRGGGVVDDGCCRSIAARRMAIGTGVGERTAGRRVVN